MLPIRFGKLMLPIFHVGLQTILLAQFSILLNQAPAVLLVKQLVPFCNANTLV
jgi:hypothetical protein